jgi:hypothetical protein
MWIDVSLSIHKIFVRRTTTLCWQKAKQVPSFLVEGQARRGVANHSLVGARFLSH